MYYERGLDGVPHRWAHIVKGAIRSTMPKFCARRMAKEYAELYLTAATVQKESSLCRT